MPARRGPGTPRACSSGFEPGFRALHASRGVWILLGIILIAALPRVWYLMAPASGGTKPSTRARRGSCRATTSCAVLRAHLPGNSNFLLYQQFVALVYFVFGVSDIAARLVSVAFSIGTVLVTFELARTLYTRRIAYISALGDRAERIRGVTRAARAARLDTDLLLRPLAARRSRNGSPGSTIVASSASRRPPL